MPLRACTHASLRTLRTLPFQGPVSRDENRAAHGNIKDEQECRACGARRFVNINGRQLEEGPWGPTSEERLTKLQALEVLVATLRRQVSPIALEGPNGEHSHLSVDSAAALRLLDAR